MDKNRMNQECIDDIKAMFPPERVLIGEEISEDYGHDELGDVFSMPEILIKAVSTEEIANIMKYASGRDIPVVVRGAGTGLVGGAVATHGGIMIETTGMNHILELDRENLTVTVEPGVLLMELAEYVEGQGLFYPPDPGEKSATIGGNISTNAGGMRAVRFRRKRNQIHTPQYRYRKQLGRKTCFQVCAPLSAACKPAREGTSLGTAVRCGAGSCGR